MFKKKEANEERVPKQMKKKLIQEYKEHPMTYDKLSSLMISSLKLCLLDFFEHVPQKLEKRRKQKKKSSKEEKRQI